MTQRLPLSAGPLNRVDAASRQPLLWKEYEHLLASHNMQVPSADVAPVWAERLRKEMQVSAEREGIHITEEALARVPVPTAGVSFQRILDDLSAQIDAALANTSIQLPFPVLAVEFPTGRFNAHARRTPTGALLLVNSGLFSLLHQATKVFALSIGLASPADEADSFALKPELAPSQTEDALARMILAYFLAGDSRYAERLPMLGGRRLSLAGRLRHNAEKFAVAHEYGHVIGGHLDDNREIALASLVGDVGVVEKNWDQEIEADVIALGILRRSTPDEIDSHAVLGDVQITVAAPVFALVLNHMVNQVGEEALNRTLMHPGSHPAPLDRAAVFRSQFESMGGDAVTQLAELCMEWGQALAAPIVARAIDVCGEHQIR